MGRRQLKSQETMDLMKCWRTVGYFSFAGLIVAILVITAFIPLTVIVIMDNIDFDLLATHRLSLQQTALWCIGIAMPAWVIYICEGLSVLVRKKIFTILCLVMVCVHFLAVFGLMIAGIIKTDNHKTFLQENWNNFDVATKSLVQKHFSCCGFDTPADTKVKDDSCYAILRESITWPTGCYHRVITVSLPAPTVRNSLNEEVTPGGASWNNFICGYAFFFLCLFAVDLLNICGLAYLLKITDFDNVKNCSTTKPINLSENRKSTLTTVTMVTDDDITESQSKEKSLPKSTSENSTDSISYTSEGNITPWYMVPSHLFTTFLEDSFYWIGFLVAKHPKRTIILSLIFSISITVGVLQRKDGGGGVEAYLSKDSKIIANTVNILDTFTIYDYHWVIIENDNVLSNEVLKKSWAFDKSVKALTSSNQSTYDTLCVKSSVGCAQQSLFELWSYDDAQISALTDADILQKIRPKASLQSTMFGGDYRIDNVIGGQVLDSSEEISSAKAHKIIYITSSSDEDWEDKLVELSLSSPEGLTVYVEADASFQNENDKTNSQELWLLSIGFVLVFFYISIMSGRLSKVRQRTWLAIIGVSVIGLGIGPGIALSASFGYQFSPLHFVIPLLLLGIGVDDMFIILQTWNIVLEDSRYSSLTIEEKAGTVLKNAGVSITVTSVTDLVVFAVGATSAMSVLQSFSLYTSLCIIFLFVMQCTFYLACTVLDQRRREQNRDACCCCYKYDETYQEGKCANREILQWFFDNGLSLALQYKFVRIGVFAITLSVAGLMSWACYKNEVEFDNLYYLPGSSFVRNYITKDRKYFTQGYPGDVYVTSDDMYAEKDKLEQLHNLLFENGGVNDVYLDSWYEAYKSWDSKSTTTTNDAQFATDVSAFINSADGVKYTHDIVFNLGGTNVVGCKMPFQHIDDNVAMNNVRYMNSIYDAITTTNFTKGAYLYSRGYYVLELTELINSEIYRSLGISLASVFIIILLTLASLQMSLWVGLCVVMTMVETAGCMYFAGIYIETTLEIVLILAVGLAVDYSAHIGHKFLTLKGSLEVRMRGTLSQVGPAVFNGGFSTFLALVSFSISSIYGYQVFFTAFSCVIAFGLWNGLVFLPSILAFVGPTPYPTATEVMFGKGVKSKNPFNIPKKISIQRT